MYLKLGKSSKVLFYVSVGRDMSRPGSDMWGATQPNRQAFLQSIGLSDRKLAYMYVQYGSEIQGANGSGMYARDALWTIKKDVVLGLSTADCFPVLVEGKDRVGLVHAGWQSIAQGIFPKLFQAWGVARHSPELESISLVFGPGICREHYFVLEPQQLKDPETRREWLPFMQSKEGDLLWAVDLVGFMRKQVTDYGITEANVSVSEFCTYEHPDMFPSYQRKAGDKASRFMSVVALT